MTSDDGSVEKKGRLRSPTFAALASIDFRRFYLGQGISLIGTWLQGAAVRWIVFEQTHSYSMLGVIEAANLMPGILVGLLAGAIADRVAPRAMIIAMEIGQLVLAFALAALVWRDESNVWAMALILALARICVTFELPSRQVFLYEMVGPKNIPNAIALNSGLFNATRVIGPAMAGFGLAFLGATGCFFVNGLSYIAAIVAVLGIRTQSPRSRVKSSRGVTLSELLGGLYYLREERIIRNHYLLMAAFGVVGMGYEAMIPAFASTIVRTGVQGYAAILACAGLGATIGAFGMASVGGIQRKERLVLAGMLIFSVFLGAGASFHLWVPARWSETLRVICAAVCLLGAGFGGVLFYAATQTRIQLIVPDHLRGRVMGVWMLVFSGSVPLGALCTGWASTSFGVPLVMGVSAMICAVMAVFTALSGILDQVEKPPKEASAIDASILA